MAREFTQSEAQQIYEAEKGLREAGLDVDHEHAKDNANLILDYFGKNPIPVTVASIYAFVEKNKDQFIWRTPAQREYDKVAAANPVAAQQLVAWLDTQGKSGQLANSGDDAYANLTLLLAEISGRRENVSSKGIQDAINRIQNRPGRKLHYVEAPRRTEPQSRAAREDDSTSANWLGRDMVKDTAGWRSKTPAEQRADREAAENAKQTQTATALSASDQQWRSMALDACNYGTHSQQAQIRQVFNQYQNTSSWREVYDRVNQTRNTLKRQREQMPA